METLNVVDSRYSQDVELNAFTQYKLASLLDMLRFYAAVYLEIASSLATTSGLLKGTSMVFKSLNKYGVGGGESMTFDFDENKEQLRAVTKDLKKTMRLCNDIQLTLSAKQCEKLIRLAKTKVTFTEWKSALDELISRINDEMSEVHLLRMPEASAIYFERPNLFGDGVFNNFASTNFDVEEAGKCLALARYTACVMHLQRVLEVGLKGYGLYLGVSLNNPSWGNILNSTKNEIGNRNSSSSWASTDEKEFCENLQALLHSVRVAWRNPSMHAGKQYTEEQAEDIYNSVRGFMRHLAEHLDETGFFTP